MTESAVDAVFLTRVVLDRVEHEYLCAVLVCRMQLIFRHARKVRTSGITAYDSMHPASHQMSALTMTAKINCIVWSAVSMRWGLPNQNISC